MCSRLNQNKSLLLGSIALWGLSACTETSKAISTPKRDKPVILSTTTLMKDLVDTLWAEQVYSESLMGPGVDPHLYQPSAKDLVKIKEADVVVAHGLHLEGKMIEALEAVSKTKTVLILGNLIDSKKLINTDGSVDPHLWFDPELWIQTAEALAKHPPSATVQTSKLTDFSQQVRALSKKYKEAFSKIPKSRRILITSHDAFRYLGLHFDIEVQGIQGVSTDAEVGIKRIDELIALIKERKIASIFSETSVSPRSIEKLLSESGAKSGGILYSDALGPVGSGAETYIGMLEKNLNTILEGLK